MRGADDPLHADLFIDGQPVEALRTKDPAIARWRWLPGFHSGIVDAELRLSGKSPCRFPVTTDPDIKKLTRDDYDLMVREILNDTFALFSLTAFRKGIAREQCNEPPPIARLEFLRSRLDEIEKVVRRIFRNPKRSLQGIDRVIPYHQAHRATSPEILKSFRTSRLLKETSTPSRLPALLKGYLPEKITLRDRYHSVDIVENRQIKACLFSWAAWLANVADLLDRFALEDDDSDTKSGKTLWAVRARRMGRTLSSLGDMPVFQEIGEAPARLSLTSVFRNDPLYRQFFRLYQDMNFGLASVFGDFLQMPLARTFELYELWCFLRLVRATEQIYGSDKVKVENLFISSPGGAVTITAGATTVYVGDEFTLCFQRQYREFWLEKDNSGSFSRTMIPDIVFSTSPSSQGTAKVIVLDAKYRISEGLNDAISSIHTYRDALVCEGKNGEIEGIVKAAYLLTPHVPLLAAGYRSTPTPGRLFHPGYREAFRFGALTLRPGMDITDIAEALKLVVADAMK